MRSSVDLDLSVWGSGQVTRRLGCDPALDLREQISEQQADWSVSEKNNLQLPVSYLCTKCAQKKAKFRFSTLPKLKYKSMGSFLIGLNNGLVQNKQTYSFWRQSLGVTFVDMEDWTASNSASQTRLSFSPQWFIIGREVVLRGLALPADDDVLPHVEAVLGLSLPPLTLHPRGHNVTRVIRVLHSDSCCDCDCSMLSPPPHCRQSPRSLVSSGSRCTSSLRATSLFSGKYKLW